MHSQRIVLVVSSIFFQNTNAGLINIMTKIQLQVIMQLINIQFSSQISANNLCILLYFYYGVSFSFLSLTIFCLYDKVDLQFFLLREWVTE